EANIARLIKHWQDANMGPIVAVRHDSVNPASPLASGQPGNQLKDFVADSGYDLLVAKTVNSAFLGQLSLADWLHDQQITDIVCCGIQTNMCVETTARMGGNLGFRVTVPLDATRTFDLVRTAADTEDRITAAELMRATAFNLDCGGFATVTTTAQLVQ
ncbi:MAG: isochorismatase family protein, partial [Propionibacteriaceae bacterium]|nr:isochorismatase family protein [Propionibacteriaceae bacterium]